MKKKILIGVGGVFAALLGASYLAVAEISRMYEDA